MRLTKRATVLFVLKAFSYIPVISLFPLYHLTAQFVQHLILISTFDIDWYRYSWSHIHAIVWICDLMWPLSDIFKDRLLTELNLYHFPEITLLTIYNFGAVRRVRGLYFFPALSTLPPENFYGVELPDARAVAAERARARHGNAHASMKIKLHFRKLKIFIACFAF